MAVDFKIQSATEYLITYGWAFLIAAIVIAALYLFIFAPTSLSPSSCTFSSGAYCQDLILGSSLTLSKMAVLLTNTNPYSIINPKITVNVSGSSYRGSCTPNFILPGGAIICNATIIPAVSQSALASGRFIFSYIPCPGGNVTLCSSNSGQGYTGTFTTHASPLLSPTTLNVTLSVQNSSQVALSTTLDKLTANVRLLGTPLSGATVNFTSNSTNAPVSPLVITTDGSGNAVSYISSNALGKVLVKASYANVTANVVVTFTPPACYTISVPSVSGASSNVILIDGVGYSSFPQQLCFGQGTSHSYSFQSPVSGGAGTQFVFSSASGCGASTQSGTLSVSSNCTLTGTYTTQYLLTTSSSPGGGGTATPSTQYYNSGTQVTLGETPNGGYFFLSWTGSGTGSYTGNAIAPTIGINAVITQQANFYSTSTTTTTSSTTTTTVPPNPGCGSYVGDAVYSSSTSLTCNLIASNSIIVEPGVTLDECGQYIQANVSLYNQGTITNTCTGGTSGSAGGGGYWTDEYHAGSCGYSKCGSGYYLWTPHNAGSGSAGGAGSTRISHFFSLVLSNGAGGAGGGGGGAGSTCNGCYYGGDSGGAGGVGGGIVEIYAANLINIGTITANGGAGSMGCDADCSHGGCLFCNWNIGGGGGGQGGSGATILYAYTTLTNTGTIQSVAGSNGAGGTEPYSYPSGAGATSSGGGAGGNGGSSSAGAGGISNQSGGSIIARTWP